MEVTLSLGPSDIDSSSNSEEDKETPTEGLVNNKFNKNSRYHRYLHL